MNCSADYVWEDFSTLKPLGWPRVMPWYHFSEDDNF